MERQKNVCILRVQFVRFYISAAVGNLLCTIQVECYVPGCLWPNTVSWLIMFVVSWQRWGLVNRSKCDNGRDG